MIGARARGLLAVVLWALPGGLAAAAPAAGPARIEPDRWRDALMAAKPATEGWPVAGLRVDLGAAQLDIVQALLVPVEGPSTRTQELLVLGEARFVLETDDPVEAYQLELFTGGRTIDETIDRAVLVVANDAAMDALRHRPGRVTLDAGQMRAVAELLAAWRSSPDFRHARLSSGLMEDAEGDPVAQSRFGAWCHSSRLGRFLYTLDPFAVEQVKLEHFVEASIGDVDADALRRRLRRDQEEGRGLSIRLEDIGIWDTWFSTTLRAPDGSRAPGGEAFEPQRYDLAVTVSSDLERIDGEARVSLAVRTAGPRVIHLELNSDLVVSEVSEGSGPPLRFLRDRQTVTVFLDAPAPSGAPVELRVRFGGVLFQRNDHGILYKRDTYAWYPHAGTVDRATYRAVIDAPQSVDILASGTKIEETVTGGRRRQTRALELPTAFFGFEIGHYAVVTRPVGHVMLEVGFLKDIPMSIAGEQDAVVDVIADALTTYEATFGPYPLDTLTVATTWQSFAQGFLGYVTLAQTVVTDVAEKSLDAVSESQVIAHELAHQWWGNRVGWASYRDQWLSEALANYSAAVWRHRRAGASADTRVASALLDMKDKRALLQAGTTIGRPVEAIGPVTLGLRLDSSVAEAYRAVVYEKGSMVFALLADQLGEDAFLGMLKEIAERVSHRAIDTETFLKALEKMSGRDLTRFADEFIYGVGYPQLHYRYAATPAEGGWDLTGTIEQVPRGFRRDRLIRVGDAGYDVAPTFRAYRDAEVSSTTVSALVTISEAKESLGAEALHARSAGVAASRMTGYRTTVSASGASAPLRLRFEDRPLHLRLDPRSFLPAPVWNETLEPKRGIERRAEALQSVGSTDEAVAAYREALGFKLEAAPEEAGSVRKGDAAWWGKRLNGRMHLSLATIALDQGRDADAEGEIKARDVGVAADAEQETAVRRKLLRARLALRRGNAKAAFDILSDVLALDIRQTESETAADALRRHSYLEGWWGLGGDYLLLAIAAHATGHEVVCREATAEAARRGADTALMAELHKPAPSGVVSPPP